ncbi:hypothetical protein [Treponema pedis]|uniref:hypothetical protein n=1 Tax=Treponema pedis TaxID=409322 RepID=UPI0003F65673|nr:hypothetical protein [Treponema pedis]
MKKNIFILLFCAACSVSLFAHAMFLDLIEPGVFKVEYDGGGFTPGTTVTLYSDGGTEEIQKGTVDENGLYRFDPKIEVVSAMAEDGAGHVAYWEPSYEESGEGSAKVLPTGKTKRPSKTLAVLTVLNTCALIYLFFEFRRFKKEKKTL